MYRYTKGTLAIKIQEEMKKGGFSDDMFKKMITDEILDLAIRMKLTPKQTIDLAFA